jgi:hypothetical protein
MVADDFDSARYTWSVLGTLSMWIAAVSDPADRLHGIEADGEQQIGATQKVPHKTVARHVERAGIQRCVSGTMPWPSAPPPPGSSTLSARRRTASPAPLHTAEWLHQHHRPPCRLQAQHWVGLHAGGRNTARARVLPAAATRYGIAGRGAHHVGGGGTRDGPGRSAIAVRSARRMIVATARLHCRGPLGDRLEQRLVVDHLVRERGLALGFDLAGDCDHRHAIEPRAGHRIDQVGRARPQG